MKKRINNVQSAYITTFRAYALNVVARTTMPYNLRKLIKQAVHEVTLPLYEVVKCSKQQAWQKYCNRFIGAVRTITGDTRELHKIIEKLGTELAKEM